MVVQDTVIFRNINPGGVFLFSRGAVSAVPMVNGNASCAPVLQFRWDESVELMVGVLELYRYESVFTSTPSRCMEDDIMKAVERIHIEMRGRMIGLIFFFFFFVANAHEGELQGELIGEFNGEFIAITYQQSTLSNTLLALSMR